MENRNVLIVTNDPDVEESLIQAIESYGYDIVTAHDEDRNTIGERVEVIILDLADESDLDKLDGLINKYSDKPLLVLVEHGNLSVAMEALGRGAKDFVQSRSRRRRFTQFLCRSMTVKRCRPRPDMMSISKRHESPSGTASSTPLWSTPRWREC